MLKDIILIGSFMILFIILSFIEGCLKDSISEMEKRMVVSSYKPTSYKDFMGMERRVRIYKFIKLVIGILITILLIGAIRYLL